MKETHGEEQRDEKADSSLRRFRFQVTAKNAESESGDENVREKAGILFGVRCGQCDELLKVRI